MPSPLVIPGVQVRTLFEPSPVVPGATGVLGIVGVTDRGPLTPTPVGNMGELLEIFGPATRFTIPEARTALANGVAQIVVARTDPGDEPILANLTLKDDEGEEVVILRARAEGPWANRLGVRVTQVKAGTGGGIKYVNLEVQYDGVTIETFNRLVMDEDSPDYLFDRINEVSRVLVALDPAFDAALPAPIGAAAPAKFLPNAAATAATKLLNGTTIIATAKRAGRAGNLSSVIVKKVEPGFVLLDNAAQPKPSVDIARKAGLTDALKIKVTETAATATDPKKWTLTITRNGSAQSIDFTKVDDLIEALKTNALVTATKLGGKPLAPQAETDLEDRVDIDIVTEGQETRHYISLSTPAGIIALADPEVAFSATTNVAPKDLPDAGEYPLEGGQNQGPALPLLGATGQKPLLELRPASPESTDLAIRVESAKTTGPVVNLFVFRGSEIIESFFGLTMDPDDPNYIVAVLSASATLRARDLFIRSRTQNFPTALPRTVRLEKGEPPLREAYQSALDRLEGAEEVDLVIASVANQLSKAEAILVQGDVVAHCTKMADVARNRIGLGSITADENDDINKILEHADSVRSDHFILCAPAGSEAALAGLLGRQDYFQSPTFKTIAAPDTQLVPYSDAQLTRLVASNVAVIMKKRGRGTICVNGSTSGGRAINVERIVNKAARDAKATTDQFVGLLNSAGTRVALQGQISGVLRQMERDGAILPSTDGQDPAFKVDVYSSQADFGNRIIRADIVLRPAQEARYIYITFVVQN
jgi:sulfur carrier protein ThiS